MKRWYLTVVHAKLHFNGTAYNRFSFTQNDPLWIGAVGVWVCLGTRHTQPSSGYSMGGLEINPPERVLWFGKFKILVVLDIFYVVVFFIFFMTKSLMQLFSNPFP